MYKLLDNVEFYSKEEIDARFSADGILAEQERAEAAEAELRGLIEAEVTRSTEKDAECEAEVRRSQEKDEQLEGMLIDETARATLAEQELGAQIVSTASSIQDNIMVEVNKATTKIQQMTAAITAEAARAEAREQAIDQALAAEVTRSTQKDTELETGLAAETARAEAAERVNAAAIQAEKTRAEAKELEIIELIAQGGGGSGGGATSAEVLAEKTRAEAEEQRIEGKLDAEIARSTNKDTELTEGLTAEIARAAQKEQELNAAITAEVTRSTQKDTELEQAVANVDDKVGNLAQLTTTVKVNIVSAINEIIANGTAGGGEVINTSEVITSAQYERWLQYDKSNRRKLIIKAGTVINLAALTDGAKTGEFVIGGDRSFAFNTALLNGVSYIVYMAFENNDIVLKASAVVDSRLGKAIGAFSTLCVEAGTDLRGISRVATGTVRANDYLLLKPYNKDYEQDFFEHYYKKVFSVKTSSALYDTVEREHPLAGFAAGDILPESVFCTTFYPSRATPVGDAMVYDRQTDIPVDVYLMSGTNQNTRSVYNATHTVSRTYELMYRDLQCVGKKPLTDAQFFSAAQGGNECTVIQGAKDWTVVGGHYDTANRRMISDIGCEEMAGYLWQILDELAPTGSTGWTSAPDPAARFGQNYGTPYELLAGGSWDYAAYCGSACRHSSATRSSSDSYCGARGSSYMVKGIK